MTIKKFCRLLAILAVVAATVVSPANKGTVQANSRIFTETSKTVKGGFLDYWEMHGGVAQQGYPISEEIQETSDIDGKVYTVQYFERAVFELHTENKPPNDVLLSLLGVSLYKQKYIGEAPGQSVSAETGTRRFVETGHSVGGLFLKYWQEHGGLAQQGYPISGEFLEKNDLDGRTYKVQYFERAVFEYHPENNPPYKVLLSQLGRFRYQAKYGSTDGGQTPPTPSFTPLPSDPSGTTSWSSDPIAGIVKSGQTETVTALMDDADSVTIMLGHFTDPTSILGFTLRDPQGRVITPDNVTSVYANSYYVPTLMGVMYLITKPVPGTWQAMVKGDKVPPDGEAFFVGGEFKGGIQIATQANPASTSVGQKVALTAIVRDSAIISGAVVTTTATLPGDPGGFAILQSAEQPNGTHVSEFIPSKPGNYFISFYATGRNSEGNNFNRSTVLLVMVK